MSEKPEPAITPVTAGIETKNGRVSKSKAAAIDLPPEAVSEIATAEPPVGNTSPPEAEAAAGPPPKVHTPKFVPGLIGLVAGAVGGFAAYQGGERLMPRPPAKPDLAIESKLQAMEQALKTISATRDRPSPGGQVSMDITERLAKAETGLVEAAKREAMLRDEMAKISTALARETSERSAAITSVSEKAGAFALIAPPAGSSVEVAAELEKLRARLAVLETTAKALPEAIGMLSAKGDAAVGRVDTLIPRLDDVTMKVETLGPKIGQVGEQVSALSKAVVGVSKREALSNAAALVTGTSVLADAFMRGEALGAPLGILRNLGVAPEALAALAPYAEKGAPSSAQLAAELKAIKLPGDEAKPAATEGKSSLGDLAERIRAGAVALVEVRRTGEVSGTDDAAHVTRAEQALQKGDIATAIALLARLTPKAGEAYAGLRTRAEARLKASEAVTRLRGEALQTLAKASAGPAGK